MAETSKKNLEIDLSVGKIVNYRELADTALALFKDNYSQEGFKPSEFRLHEKMLRMQLMNTGSARFRNDPTARDGLLVTPLDDKNNELGIISVSSGHIELNMPKLKLFTDLQNRFNALTNIYLHESWIKNPLNVSKNAEFRKKLGENAVDIVMHAFEQCEDHRSKFENKQIIPVSSIFKPDA